MRKLVSFLYALNSICNVLLVYDMSHGRRQQKKQRQRQLQRHQHHHIEALHSIKTLELEREKNQHTGWLAGWLVGCDWCLAESGRHEFDAFGIV